MVAKAVHRSAAAGAESANFLGQRDTQPIPGVQPPRLGRKIWCSESDIRAVVSAASLLEHSSFSFRIRREARLSQSLARAASTTDCHRCCFSQSLSMFSGESG